MADIDIVKKRSSVWPWIVGLVVLALVVWLLLGMFTTGTDPVTAPAVSLPALDTLAAALETDAAV